MRDEHVMVRLNAVEERMLESIRDHLAVPLYRPTQENALRIAVGMCYYQLIHEGKIQAEDQQTRNGGGRGGVNPFAGETDE